MTHRTTWPEAQVNVGDQRHLSSIAQQKEANATLVGTKQDSMLLSNFLLKGAIKKKVLLILNSIQVATADRCADPGSPHRKPPVSFNPQAEPV